MPPKADPYATKLHRRIDLILLVLIIALVALLLRSSGHAQTRIRSEWEQDDWWAHTAVFSFPKYVFTLASLSPWVTSSVARDPVADVRNVEPSQPDVITGAITWGNTTANFNANNSWVGGVAPGTADIATFSSASIDFQPNLTANKTVAGLNFTTAGWDLTSSSTSVKLTLNSAGSGSSGAVNSGIGAGTNTIDAPIILDAAGGGVRSFTQASGGTLRLNGIISSTGNVTMSLASTGTIEINGTNTYTGSTQWVNAGNTTVIGNSAAFGTSTILFNQNNTIKAAVDLTGANKITNAITLQGSPTFQNDLGFDLEFGGTVNLSTAARSFTANTGTITFDGVISNDGGLGLSIVTVNNSVVVLNGSNTYTGKTTISGTGKLIVSTIGNSGANGNLGAGTTINLGSTTTSGALLYTGAGETTTKVVNLNGTSGGATIDTTGATGALTFSSDLTATGGGSKTLTLAGDSTGNTVSGKIVDNSITNKTSLQKLGTGMWILAGANTYTGATSVSGGTLLANNVSGSATGTGAVTVSNSGTVLGGTGTISGAVTINGNAKLQGGDGITGTTLTLSGAVTLSNNSIVQLALGPSFTHSSLARSGSSTWTFDSNQAFTLLDLGATAGTYDNIITGLAGPVVTTGWTINNPGWVGSFVFDGANIDLTLTAMPEPSTWLAAALAAMVIGYSQRRRFSRGARRVAGA